MPAPAERVHQDGAGTAALRAHACARSDMCARAPVPIAVCWHGITPHRGHLCPADVGLSPRRESSPHCFGNVCALRAGSMRNGDPEDAWWGGTQHRLFAHACLHEAGADVSALPKPGVRISAKGKSPCVGPWLCRHTALSHQNQEPGAGREAPQGALHPCGVLWDKGLEPEPCVSTVEGAPRLGGLEAEWGRHPRKRWLQEEGGSQAPGFARGTNPAWCLGWG